MFFAAKDSSNDMNQWTFSIWNYWSFKISQLIIDVFVEATSPKYHQEGNKNTLLKTNISPEKPILKMLVP